MGIKKFTDSYNELKSFVSEDGLSPLEQLKQLQEWEDKINGVIEALLDCPVTEGVSQKMINKKIEQFTTLQLDANNMVRELSGFIRLNEAIMLSDKASEKLLSSLKKPDSIELLIEIMGHKTEMSKLRSCIHSIEVVNPKDEADKSSALGVIECGIGFADSEIERLEKLNNLGLFSEDSKLQAESYAIKNQNYSDKVYPTKEQFETFDCKDDVIKSFEEHKQRFESSIAKVPSKKLFIENEIKNQEAFRDNINPPQRTCFRGVINMYPFFKTGWDCAINGDFEVANNMHKFTPDVMDTMFCLDEMFQNKYNDNVYDAFEKLSKMAMEEAVDGMARCLYYVWLTEGANDQPVRNDNNSYPTINKKIHGFTAYDIYTKYGQWFDCTEDTFVKLLGDGKPSGNKIGWIYPSKANPNKGQLRKLIEVLTGDHPKPKYYRDVFGIEINCNNTPSNTLKKEFKDITVAAQKIKISNK